MVRVDTALTPRPQGAMHLLRLCVLACAGRPRARRSPQTPREGPATSALAEVLTETPCARQTGRCPHGCPAICSSRAPRNSRVATTVSRTPDGFASSCAGDSTGAETTPLVRVFCGGTLNVSTRTDRICLARLLGVVQPKQSELPALTNNCSDNFNVNVFPSRMMSWHWRSPAGCEGHGRLDHDQARMERLKIYFDKISAAHPAANGRVVANYVERINPLAITGIGFHQPSKTLWINKETRRPAPFCKRSKSKGCPTYIHSRSRKTTLFSLPRR